MEDIEKIRKYKDRLRIFLILYSFADDFSDPLKSNCKKLFKGETRIQKIDFLLRNPDYLSYELLNLASKTSSNLTEVKDIVKNIFATKEPIIRRLEMERFFFGAYEDIDDVIGFLKSIGFIEFSSKKSIDLRTIDKHYFITDLAVSKLQTVLPTLPSLQWYFDRCSLIKKYFGDLTGSQLKVAQYQIKEYRTTSYNEYIGSIQELVKEEYSKLYNEVL
jgi:hypothetical protein